MKLIETSAEFIPQEDLYKQIEIAGRCCYKSEDKITEDSAKAFVDRMTKSNHLAMLEHGTVYLKYPFGGNYVKYHENPYSRLKMLQDGDFAVTTNLRVLVENGWMDDLQYLCDPLPEHMMRYSFKLTTSIGVTRELNRHRVNSIAEQSTRYCNYSKDKFGGEVSFCIPAWMPQTEKTIDTSNGFGVLAGEELFAFLGKAERHYFYLLGQGWQPQQAREVLPLCTATEVVYTAFASDWKHFFDLRYFETTGKVHPNMLELTTKMKRVAEEANIWDEIMKY